MAYLFSVYAGRSLPILQPVAFALYFLNAAEGIAASLILTKPGKDIPSLWHVLAQGRSLDAKDRP